MLTLMQQGKWGGRENCRRLQEVIGSSSGDVGLSATGRRVELEERIPEGVV